VEGEKEKVQEKNKNASQKRSRVPPGREKTREHGGRGAVKVVSPRETCSIQRGTNLGVSIKGKNCESVRGKNGRCIGRNEYRKLKGKLEAVKRSFGSMHIERNLKGDPGKIS